MTWSGGGHVSQEAGDSAALSPDTPPVRCQRYLQMHLKCFFSPSTVSCTHSVAVADDHCLLCSSDNIKTLNFAHENPAATVDDDDDVMLQIFGREHCGLAKN